MQPPTAQVINDGGGGDSSRRRRLGDDCGGRLLIAAPFHEPRPPPPPLETGGATAAERSVSSQAVTSRSTCKLHPLPSDVTGGGSERRWQREEVASIVMGFISVSSVGWHDIVAVCGRGCLLMLLINKRFTE